MSSEYKGHTTQKLGTACKNDENDDMEPVDYKYRYIRNSHINEKEDVLFHLKFSNRTEDLKAMFHDVKFVCMGGTVSRMKRIAEYLRKELTLPEDDKLQDLTGKGDRYSMFKVGCVLCVNHGMGFPSLMILLHELIKLMEYAGVHDPVFIRTGTCGGFNVAPGTVVIATEALNDFLEPDLELPILAKMYKWPCVLDKTIARDLKAIADEKDDISVLLGCTISHLYFYEGAAMKTGAICEHSDEDRKEYFNKLKRANVLCVDMETLALGAITHKTGIKAASVCVVGNDVSAEKEYVPTADQLADWERKPGIIVAEYIKKQCKAL